MDQRDDIREAIMAHVQSGGKLPDRNPSRPPDIETGKVGQWQSYVILSPELHVVWQHWMGDRSLPCLKRHGKCPVDLHTRPIIWRGYVDALGYATGGICWPAVIGFTQPALIACPKLFALHDELLMRGTSIRLTRNTGRQKSQRVELISEWDGKGELPLPRDLGEFLWTVWRNDSRLRKWAAELEAPKPQKGGDDAESF